MRRLSFSPGPFALLLFLESRRGFARCLRGKQKSFVKTPEPRKITQTMAYRLHGDFMEILTGQRRRCKLNSHAEKLPATVNWAMMLVLAWLISCQCVL